MISMILLTGMSPLTVCLVGSGVEIDQLRATNIRLVSEDFKAKHREVTTILWGTTAR